MIKCAPTICIVRTEENQDKSICYTYNSSNLGRSHCEISETDNKQIYLCKSSLEGGRNSSFLCEKRDLTLFSKSWSASCIDYSPSSQNSFTMYKQLKSCFHNCSLYITIYMQFSYDHNGQNYKIYFKTNSIESKDKKGSYSFLIKNLFKKIMHMNLKIINKKDERNFRAPYQSATHTNDNSLWCYWLHCI